MRYLDTAIGTDQHLSLALLSELADADLVAIRTGFSSLRGIELVIDALEAVLARGGQVYIVLGGADDQADPAGLLLFAQLAEDYPNASVRIVTDPEVFQNAKTYYIRDGAGRSRAWVGSANLTLSGFTSNDEAVMVIDPEDPEELKDAVLHGVQAYATGRGSEALTIDVVRRIEAEQAAYFSRKAPAAEDPAPTSMLLADTLESLVNHVDAVATATAQGETPEGAIATGFGDLDVLTSGLRPGQLVVIASRPQVGKSTLLLDLARSCSIAQGLPAAFFTLEATQQEVSSRIVCAEARLRMSDFRGGTLTDEDWMRLARRMSDIADAPMFISSYSTVRVAKLCVDVTQLVANHGVRAVFVDSLNAVSGSIEPGASREREVSTVVRKLKALALRLEIPIVVTAELGRTVQNRLDQRPMLDDTRESDTIIQVADVVMMIYRPDAFERDHVRAGEADLIVAKHRNGPTATVTVAHQLHYGRFTDLPQS